TKTSGLNLAIGRFNFAYDRFQLEDKLIDYMVAFEALFLKKEESSEITHRMSTRVAKLLGKSFDEKRRIQKEIKDFYDKRSRVVHGGPAELNDELVLKIENRLRSSFKALLPMLKG